MRIAQAGRLDVDGKGAIDTFDKVGDAGERMSARIRGGVQSLPPALRALDAVAADVKEGLETSAASAGTLGKALTAIGPAGLLAAGAVGGSVLAFNALASAAREAASYMDDIYGASQRANVSVEFLQELRYAAVEAGEDMRAADAALASFAQKLGEARLGMQEPRNAFNALGISNEEIMRLGSVEEMIPRIAEAVSNLDGATARGLTNKLGLAGISNVMREGADAMERTAQRARELGIVLDEETIKRGQHMGAAWSAASMALDVSFKTAAIEFLPYATRLLQWTSEMARGLSGIVDQMNRVEDRGTENLRHQAQQLGWEHERLVREQWRLGGRATPGLSSADFAGVDPTSPLAGAIGAMASMQAPNTRISSLEAQIKEINDEIARRDATRQLPGAGGDTVNLVNTPSAALTAANSLIETLRTQEAARLRLLEVEKRFPGVAREEAQARAELTRTMAQLDDARRIGAISSDAELERLRAMARASFDAGQAERSRARALEDTRALEARVTAQRGATETDVEKLQRQERELRELYAQSQGLSPDQRLSKEDYHRGLARIADEYKRIADAQREASFAGQTLQSVLDGQIKSWNDLLSVVARMIGEVFVDEAKAGGPGGLGGLLGRVGNGVLERLGGPRADRDMDALGMSARVASDALKQGVAHSAAESATKIALATAATQVETAQKHAATLSLGVMSKSAQAASAALQKVARAGGGGDKTDIASAAFSALIGPGRAEGGGAWPGYLHRYNERGPELLLLGGKADVLPTEDFQGLRALTRMLSQSAPRAASAPPQVNVTIKNDTGVAAEAETTTKQRADGGFDIEIALRRQVAGEIAAGGMDGPLNARFGASRRRIPRG